MSARRNWPSRLAMLMRLIEGPCSVREMAITAGLTDAKACNIASAWARRGYIEIARPAQPRHLGRYRMAALWRLCPQRSGPGLTSHKRPFEGTAPAGRPVKQSHNL